MVESCLPCSRFMIVSTLGLSTYDSFHSSIVSTLAKSDSFHFSIVSTLAFYERFHSSIVPRLANYDSFHSSIVPTLAEYDSCFFSIAPTLGVQRRRSSPAPCPQPWCVASWRVAALGHRCSPMTEAYYSPSASSDRS